MRGIQMAIDGSTLSEYNLCKARMELLSGNDVPSGSFSGCPCWCLPLSLIVEICQNKWKLCVSYISVDCVPFLTFVQVLNA